MWLNSSNFAVVNHYVPRKKKETQLKEFNTDNISMCQEFDY